MYEIAWMIIGIAAWLIVPHVLIFLCCFITNFWRLHRFMYWDAKLKPGHSRWSWLWILDTPSREWDFLRISIRDSWRGHTPTWESV